MTIQDKAKVLRDALADQGFLVEIAKDASQLTQLSGYVLYPFGANIFYQLDWQTLVCYAERYTEADIANVVKFAHENGYDIIVAYKPDQFRPHRRRYLDNFPTASVTIDKSALIYLFLFPMHDEGTPEAVRRHHLELMGA